MPTNANGSRTATRYAIVAAALALLLALLGVFYYFLTRPQQLYGEAGQRDRNFLFSIYGFEGDLLRRPSGVDVAPNGDIYVADTGKRRIVVFDADGTYKTSYGNAGTKPLDIWEPLGVAVAPDGRSYVLDKSKNKVVIFDTQRKAQKVVTFEEAPLSIRVADGRLFVTTESGVLIGDLDGELLTGYVARGKNPGQFDRPGGVAVGSDGTLYVADSLNYRVQAIDVKGRPLWQYGQPLPPGQAMNTQGGADRKFGLPANITIDDRGNLYVVDGLNSELIVLSSEGEYIGKVGDVGHDDGTFYYPDGIDHQAGRLVVADKFNDRIEVFAVPTAFGPQWASYWPYALVIVPLPFLALLFLRRRRAWIAAPDFLDALERDPEGAAIARVLKKAFIPEVLSERSNDLAHLGVDWLPRKAREGDVAALSDRYELNQVQSAALAVASRLRRRRVLLTDDTVLRAAADDLGVPMLGYQEMSQAAGAAPAPASAEES